MADFLTELEESKRKEEEATRKKAQRDARPKHWWNRGYKKQEEQKRKDQIYYSYQRNKDTVDKLRAELKEYISRVRQINSYPIQLYETVGPRIEIRAFDREGGHNVERTVVIFPINDEVEIRFMVQDEKVGYDYEASTFRERTVKKLSIPVTRVTAEHISSCVAFAATGKY